MATAFQKSAFQNNAFQIDTGGGGGSGEAQHQVLFIANVGTMMARIFILWFIT